DEERLHPDHPRQPSHPLEREVEDRAHEEEVSADQADEDALADLARAFLERVHDRLRLRPRRLEEELGAAALCAPLHDPSPEGPEELLGLLRPVRLVVEREEARRAPPETQLRVEPPRVALVERVPAVAGGREDLLRTAALHRVEELDR